MLGDKQKDFHSDYYYPIKSVVVSQYYPILLDDLQIPTAVIYGSRISFGIDYFLLLRV